MGAVEISSLRLLFTMYILRVSLRLQVSYRLAYMFHLFYAFHMLRSPSSRLFLVYRPTCLVYRIGLHVSLRQRVSSNYEFHKGYVFISLSSSVPDASHLATRHE